MSHDTMLSKLGLKDPNLIIAALSALIQNGLNAEIKYNAVPRMYYDDQYRKRFGPTATAEIVLSLHDSKYDVAYRFDQKEGEYEMVMDVHGDHIRKQIGVPMAYDQRNKFPEKARLSNVTQFTMAYFGVMAQQEQQSLANNDFDAEFQPAQVRQQTSADGKCFLIIE